MISEGNEKMANFFADTLVPIIEEGMEAARGGNPE